MQPDQTLKLENQICFAIYACSRELTKLYRPLLQELGLTYTQYVTMLALWEQDQVTVSALGAKLYLDSGTLTPLLKKLEAAGLVTRTRDKNDERNVVIALTEQGSQLREQALDIPEKLLCQLDASPEEGAFLLAQMQELMARVQQRANTADSNTKGDE
ncbi:MarR family transcriptional regulator [Paenibacillus sp. 1011MAR3C5]|uniref:MarR family winged helix-turn-helix transcriptional regulator n=1 Tax=Paenibacillus sp. 1011MAR3C5 TaxID=1675787 RepID=UPI000E6C9CB6|nr:MarR family transcriptional regulator [Paenibacillus sp. 1011MAR3C5]RJE84328.1 MarR family transcriptional regulator [Paenibacillus sp. 1011MAR3C5]